MKEFHFSRMLMVVLLISTQIFTKNTDADSTSDTFTFKPSGYVALQTLRIKRYRYAGADFRYQSSNNTILNLTLNLKYGEHFAIHAGVEGYVWFNTMPDNAITSGQTRIMDPQWAFYIHQAENVFSFGNQSVFAGELGIGYFPYKYNNEVRNLGEYLFRSGTYPGWLITNFDWPQARLTGLRFSSTLFDKWRNDLLITTEMELYPLYDLSFSWISSLSLANSIDLGAGIVFSRAIPFKKDWTTPPKTLSTSSVDNSYIQSNGDTAFYTFRGTKLMGRITIDPKGLFSLFGGETPRCFGKEDGKLYAELSILGLKNQINHAADTGLLKHPYEDVGQRMPIMFGFNVPAFKLLDVLALEFEYYNSPFPNSFGRQQIFFWDGTPLPEDPGIDSELYEQDDWKWSVYTKRSIGKHFAIIAQFARDHWRTKSSIGYYVNDPKESLIKKNQWYWALKAVGIF